MSHHATTVANPINSGTRPSEDSQLPPGVIGELLNTDFYRQYGWFERFMEIVFRLRQRGVTAREEVYYGVIQFISCLYVLAVVPQQLDAAGYNSHATVCIVAGVSGLGSILAGLITNLPIIVVPPTAVSIFLSVFIRQYDMPFQNASTAVVGAGLMLMLFGSRALGRLITVCIPDCLKVGVAIGIGLFTSMAGSTDVNLAVNGEYTLLQMGYVSPEVLITFSGVIIIAVALHYHFKASFCYSLIFCTLVWWIYSGDWPGSVVQTPNVLANAFPKTRSRIILLTFDIFILNVLFLNGLVGALSELAKLTRKDGSVPRGRWFYILCGLMSVLSGFFNGAPVLISPESSAGIKAGAKTGLSSVVCGCLFLLSAFFAPVFVGIPYAATSGVLIVIGALLFQNVSKLDWKKIDEAIPCYCTLFYILATYSILKGAAIGYCVYIIMHIFTGDIEIVIRSAIAAFLDPVKFKKDQKLAKKQKQRKKQRKYRNSADNDNKHSIAGVLSQGPTTSNAVTDSKNDKGSTEEADQNNRVSFFLEETRSEQLLSNETVTNTITSQEVPIRSCIATFFEWLALDQPDMMTDMNMGLYVGDVDDTQEGMGESDDDDCDLENDLGEPRNNIVTEL